MSTLAIIFNSLFMIWLFATLYFLWRIMQLNVKRTEKLETTLADTAMKSVETAQRLARQLEEKSNENI